MTSSHPASSFFRRHDPTMHDPSKLTVEAEGFGGGHENDKPSLGRGRLRTTTEDTFPI